MDVFKHHKTVPRPRLITHRGIFLKARKNTSACSATTNLKFYTTQENDLLTGFPQKLIEDHHFNQQVAIVAADADSSTLGPVAQLFEAAIGSLSTYLVDADISKLLTSAFIAEYVSVSSGYKFHAVSINTPNARCNTMAIANGRLWLSVDKDTHQTLGLSSSYEVIEDKYVSNIDLSSITPNRLAHLHWCLSSERIGTAKFAIFATKGNLPQEITFPQGVTVVRKLKASYGDGTHAGSCMTRTELVPDLSFFTQALMDPCVDSEPAGAAIMKDDGVLAKKDKPKEKFATDTEEGFISLDMDSEDEDDGDDSEISGNLSDLGSVHAFPKMEDVKGLDLATLQVWDWLGLITTGSNEALAVFKAKEQEDGTVRAVPPKNNLTVLSDPLSALPMSKTQLSICRARQLIPACTVSHAAKHARSLVSSGKASWSAVMCWGVPDTPCVYGNYAHGHSHGVSGRGESNYAVIFLPDDKYVVLWGVDAHSKVM